MSDEEQQFEKRMFACMGLRLTHKGEKRLALIPYVGEVIADQEECLWFKYRKGRWICGAVYEIEAATAADGEGTTIKLDTAKFQRQFADKAKVLEWQTGEDAARLVLGTRRAEAAAQKPLALDRLEPIRNVYRRSGLMERLAIEVRVLAYLRQVRVKGGE